MKRSIHRLIKLIPEWQGQLIKVNPLNKGLTNINFEVIVGEKSYFLSIPSTNFELLNIDYKNKYYNNKICGEINLSPKVTHFIESENFLNNFNMFTLISSYQNVIKQELFSKNMLRCLNIIKMLEPKLFLPNEMLLPCHNDLLPENIINKDNQLFIIDFDYSGNNDPCFELGNLSVEMEYNNEQIDKLIKFYYGEVNERIICRVNLQAIVSDIGWSLWSYVQVVNSSIEFDFCEHAKYRLERAINKIETKEFNLWKKSI